MAAFDKEQSFLINPIQPFWVKNAQRRYLKNTLPDSPVAHFYMFTTGSKDLDSAVIPDGCVDIVFECSRGSAAAYLCGPVTAYLGIPLQPETTYFGVRCRPGILPPVPDVQLPEILDKRLSLHGTAGMCRYLAEQIAAARNFRERIDIFTKALMADYGGWGYPGHNLTAQILDLIVRRRGCLRIDELSDELHYSIRYIDKVFRDRVGINPKYYCRMIRFQTLIQRIRAMDPYKRMKLTELALEMGYYDHSHMLKDFKDFTYMSPSEFLGLFGDLQYRSKVYEISYGYSLHECP